MRTKGLIRVVKEELIVVGEKRQFDSSHKSCQTARKREGKKGGGVFDSDRKKRFFREGKRGKDDYPLKGNDRLAINRDY